MNQLPIMPIRAKYADETANGKNIDDALQEAAGDVGAVETRVETLETTVGNAEGGLVKDVSNLKTIVGDSSSGLVKDVEDIKDTAVFKESNGDVKIFEDIVDSEGHKRFTDGNMNFSGTGITYTYTKWTLSGSHLLLVIAGKIDANTTITAYGLGGDIAIPEWIGQKIFPAVNTFVDCSLFYTTKNGAQLTENSILMYLSKTSNTVLSCKNLWQVVVGSDDEYFRIVFDLIIE